MKRDSVNHRALENRMFSLTGMLKQGKHFQPSSFASFVAFPTSARPNKHNPKPFSVLVGGNWDRTSWAIARLLVGHQGHRLRSAACICIRDGVSWSCGRHPCRDSPMLPLDWPFCMLAMLMDN